MFQLERLLRRRIPPHYGGIVRIFSVRLCSNDNRTEFEIYVRQVFANCSLLEDSEEDAAADSAVAPDEVTSELPLIKMVDYHHKRVVRLREEHSLRKYSAGIIAVLSLFVLLIIYIVITLVKHLSSSRA